MLEHLEPKNVFAYFEEICNIPHGSGNVKKISNYLMDFAEKNGLRASQDKWNNVTIKKPAFPGKEDRPPIMIQGHMDMVAVKEPDADIDMTKDPLRLSIDGDYVYAKQTSLGGDDGIAVAFGMALLSSENISHPALELVVTTEEEVGMEGAIGIDLSACESRMLLNIDSETEGEFVTACAGGVSVKGMIPVKRIRQDSHGLWRKIEVKGFAGGHSGTEIHKNGANANIVLGEILGELAAEEDIKIKVFGGGSKDNAIPVEADAIVGIPLKGEETEEELDKKAASFRSLCKRLEKKMQEKYKVTDPNCVLTVTDFDKEPAACEGYLEPVFQKDMLALLAQAPNGVQAMSKEPEGLVQTSLNLGIMELGEEEFKIVFSVRSSDGGEKEDVMQKVCSLLAAYGGSTETTGDYPAWEYRKDSPLREHMVRVYEKQYGKKPTVLSIHAGLECGILAAKVPGLDCVSFGPDILDIHTTRERMRISSVKRVWDFLVEVIETI
ncbi:MAG: aminoacyl-histidine dipeptidase [Lachnospiraceae bacterium]|nr:aminoacyl-histidine dipeptidase [Lachnospiraceae bacterium]